MATGIWTILPAFLLVVVYTGTSREKADLDDLDEARALQQEPARQISFEQVVVIRVPRTSRSHGAAEASEQTARCMPAKTMLGMRVSSRESLDVLTRGGWYRAHLSGNCDARQFYSGFYMEKPEDGLFCSHREELHSRSGSVCTVDRFTAI